MTSQIARIDPKDGNAYIVESFDNVRKRVTITDIEGGHEATIDESEWASWEELSSQTAEHGD